MNQSMKRVLDAGGRVSFERDGTVRAYVIRVESLDAEGQRRLSGQWCAAVEAVEQYRFDLLEDLLTKACEAFLAKLTAVEPQSR